MKRNVNLYLGDILKSIKSIESFSEGLTKEKLVSDDLHQSAIIRQLEIIGEATKNIPNSFREKYPEVPWKDISGFRDVMIHGYAKDSGENHGIHAVDESLGIQKFQTNPAL